MTVSSTRIDRWNWPRLFRDTVTCDGTAPSGNGLDQGCVFLKGVLIRIILVTRSWW